MIAELLPLRCCVHTSGPAERAEVFVQSVCPVRTQVNGKMRGTVEVPKDISQAAALEAALGALDNVRAQLEGKDVKKVIFVPGKILNLIVGK